MATTPPRRSAARGRLVAVRSLLIVFAVLFVSIKNALDAQRERREGKRGHYPASLLRPTPHRYEHHTILMRLQRVCLFGEKKEPVSRDEFSWLVVYKKGNSTLETLDRYLTGSMVKGYLSSFCQKPTHDL